MSKKRSSFHMGNEFNGFAEKVYLKAERNEVSPISQENAKITPDYSQFALKAIGAMPVVLDPENMDSTMKKMLGCLPVVNQVMIDKNEADGSYQTSVHVAAGGFTANAYPTYVGKTKGVKKDSVVYFAVSRNMAKPVYIRDLPSKKGEIIKELKGGEGVSVIREDGVVVCKRKAKAKYKWLKVGFFENDKFVEGWVREDNLREAKPRLITFPDKVEIKYKKLNKKNSEKITLNPCDKWFVLGGGEKYPKIPRTFGDRWGVAVGPEILEENYNENRGVLSEDFFSFSKCIEVHLVHKKNNSELVLKCQVVDIKAHSYTDYGYKNKNTGKNEDNIEKAKVIAKDLKNGLFQTGIRYPNATNGSPISAIDHMDGSIIEFCGHVLPNGLREKLENYKLSYIRTNYTSDTRGQMFEKVKI